MQTLIKLERWSDAEEFCDRALHVDDKCVKALSRRATVLLRLAGECTGLAGVATCPEAAAPSASWSSALEKETREIENDTSASSATDGMAEGCSKEVVSRTVNGDGEGDRKTTSPHERFGGREGLMALALRDLNTAVGIDPIDEDVRRQRDAIRKEIEEEKVIKII